MVTHLSFTTFSLIQEVPSFPTLSTAQSNPHFKESSESDENFANSHFFCAAVGKNADLQMCCVVVSITTVLPGWMSSSRWFCNCSSDLFVQLTGGLPSFSLSLSFFFLKGILVLSC
jgi:hypothetical protein